ncbi:LysM peptidoglycan-binding domain-containing protein [Kiritimatiellaeota bacterium B1221]|nr:LysM peptidoglycan-binding domain-containing protein [Kiritimatiellaeota bacterium B1221]
MRALILFLLTFLFMLTGCNRYQGSDETEKDHPKLVEARDLVRVQDPEGAEEVLLKFWFDHPDYALTHVQLGLLYQSNNEPVKALYHFQQYMEMRPDSKRVEMLEQVVDSALRRLAASYVSSNSPVIPGSEGASIQELQAKLAEAQQKQAEAEVHLQQLRQQTGGGGNRPPPAWAEEKLQLLAQIRRLESGQAAPPVVQEEEVTPSERIYTVKRGDTLSRISQKMYGEASQWRKIYEANRAKIPNQNALKLGTELVIPHE